MTVVVVMEGNNERGDRGRRYRASATQLFENASGRTDVDVVLAGGRSNASAEFDSRVGGDADLVLLVDSEALVSPGDAAWEHLAKLTGGDQIARPNGVRDDDAQLMAVSTETWVLAGQTLATTLAIDPAFHNDDADVEGVTKSTVLHDAQVVFGKTIMKRKVLLALGDVDHHRLRRKAPHADAFFTRLLRDVVT